MRAPAWYARLVAMLLTLVLGVVARPQIASADESPKLATERVILRTVAGDLVLALYPEVAPKTVEQILKLVRAGVYDGTAFVRIEPNFVTQLSAHYDRTTPVTDEQKALIHKLPAEFSSIQHVRGTVSMAREDADVNSAETSFSILLAPAPHLDGKYTVFGKLEAGDAVLTEMVNVPRGPLSRPVVRLDVLKAEVVDVNDLRTTRLAPARRVPVSAEQAAQAAPGSRPAAAGLSTSPGGGGKGEMGPEVAAGLALVCFIGLISFFLQGRVRPGILGSLNLVIVLVAAFLLLVVAVPRGQQSPWLATVLFFGLIGLFRVLGKFEQPPPKPAEK